MDSKGKSFIVSGNLSTVKSREAYCQIVCPDCHFIFYTYHKPGSCLKIVCTECHALFMGIVKTVNCGECEERLKCLGLRSIPFELVDPNRKIRITHENTVMPSGQYELVIESMKEAMKHGGFQGVRIKANAIVEQD